KIVNKIEQDKQNRIQDEKMISEAVRVLDDTTFGIFSPRINATPHSSHLKKLQEQMNQSMELIDNALFEIEHITYEYAQKNFVVEARSNYQGSFASIIDNLKTLALNQSNTLLHQFEYLMTVDSSMNMVNNYTYSNSERLGKILDSIKKALHFIENDSKFIFELDNAIKVVKQENSYVNNLIKSFSQKYIASIKLLVEFKSGSFDSKPDRLLERFNEIVKDSSVRDAKAQQELIEKIHELTNHNLRDIDDTKLKELLNLLIQELLKDIQYSLELIEKSLAKLMSNSSNRVSSFAHIQDLTKSSHTTILDEIQNADNIRKVIKNISNQANDMKYEIIDEYDFRDREKVNKLLDNRKDSLNG
ncbi:MAG: hypothetical protein JXQ76_10505, partial [Campylobacterales bacterium]|nr:hypothetical protein [Campylobacterales bacterium]